MVLLITNLTPAPGKPQFVIIATRRDTFHLFATVERKDVLVVDPARNRTKSLALAQEPLLPKHLTMTRMEPRQAVYTPVWQRSLPSTYRRLPSTLLAYQSRFPHEMAIEGLHFLWMLSRILEPLVQSYLMIWLEPTATPFRRPRKGSLQPMIHLFTVKGNYTSWLMDTSFDLSSHHPSGMI